VQGFGLGFPVSGIAVPETVLVARVSGAAWLTGGDYGPEGGLLASLVIIAVTGYLLRSKRIYVSKEMNALVFGPTAAPTPPLDVPAAPRGVNNPPDHGQTGQG
jgi:hypothetical protein